MDGDEQRVDHADLDPSSGWHPALYEGPSRRMHTPEARHRYVTPRHFARKKPFPRAAGLEQTVGRRRDGSGRPREPHHAGELVGVE